MLKRSNYNDNVHVQHQKTTVCYNKHTYRQALYKHDAENLQTVQNVTNTTTSCQYC